MDARIKAALGKVKVARENEIFSKDRLVPGIIGRHQHQPSMGLVLTKASFSLVIPQINVISNSLTEFLLRTFSHFCFLFVVLFV